MQRSGVIFSYKQYQADKLRKQLRRKLIPGILHIVGNLFIIIASFGLLTTFGPVLAQEVNYRFNRLRGVTYEVVDVSGVQIAGQQKTETAPTNSFFASIIPQKNRQLLTPVNTDFGIVIPKIGANSSVIANVNAADPDVYLQALKKGVAHAAGTGLPGKNSFNGNIYLFAHSTDTFFNVARYNAVFYLLKELEPGDEVDIFFEGKRYIYIVEEKKIVAPDEVKYLTEVTQQEQLVLQTCWPPGTIMKRLLVFAKPKASLVAGSKTTGANSSGFRALVK